MDGNKIYPITRRANKIPVLERLVRQKTTIQPIKHALIAYLGRGDEETRRFTCYGKVLGASAATVVAPFREIEDRTVNK